MGNHSSFSVCRFVRALLRGRHCMEPRYRSGGLLKSYHNVTAAFDKSSRNKIVEQKKKRNRKSKKVSNSRWDLFTCSKKWCKKLAHNKKKLESQRKWISWKEQVDKTGLVMRGVKKISERLEQKPRRRNSPVKTIRTCLHSVRREDANKSSGSERGRGRSRDNKNDHDSIETIIKYGDRRETAIISAAPTLLTEEEEYKNMWTINLCFSTRFFEEFKIFCRSILCHKC